MVTRPCAQTLSRHHVFADRNTSGSVVCVCGVKPNKQERKAYELAVRRFSADRILTPAR